MDLHVAPRYCIFHYSVYAGKDHAIKIEVIVRFSEIRSEAGVYRFFLSRLVVIPVMWKDLVHVRNTVDLRW